MGKSYFVKSTDGWINSTIIIIIIIPQMVKSQRELLFPMFEPSIFFFIRSLSFIWSDTPTETNITSAAGAHAEYQVNNL